MEIDKKEAKRLRDAEYRKNNREKIRLWHENNYRKNHEVRLATKAKSREKNYESTRERDNAIARRKRQDVRNQIFDILGRKCVQCGYDADVRALQIDHVNGGGSKERKDFPSGEAYNKYILQNAHLGAYQVLCANCNAIKRIENKEHSPGRPRKRKVE